MKSLRKTLWKAATAAAGLAVLFGAGHAYADGKSLPGSACSASIGSETYRFSGLHHISVNQEGGVVRCPILRDNTSNTNGLNWLKVHYTSDAQIRCFVYSVAPSGEVAKGTSILANPSTAGTIDFGRSIDASASGGSYGLFCVMPANSTIWGYTCDEF